MIYEIIKINIEHIQYVLNTIKSIHMYNIRTYVGMDYLSMQYKKK
jgi:hypothetical protein